MELPLEFKCHPYEMAFGGSQYETGPMNDTPEKAKMLTTYWGSARIGFPGPSSMSVFLGAACRAYDLIHDAKGSDGRQVWSDAARQSVERNLILEFALEAKPWLGGPGQAQNICNLAPQVYYGLAAVGVCLGLPDYAHATDIAGIRFQGALGIVCRKPEADGWCFSVGAGTMADGDGGIVGKSAWWEGKAVSHTENRIIAETKQPADWPPDVPGVQNYVIVEDGKYWTGSPCGRPARTSLRFNDSRCRRSTVSVYPP